MEFEIDVSGEDIFSKDYTICIASKNNTITGFKMNPELVTNINCKFNQNEYRYKNSKKGRTQLKIRIYCIIIYYGLKHLNLNAEKLSLKICRDFYGKETDIKSNLEFFITQKLKTILKEISFTKLDKESNAHKYSYLMRKDTKNQLKTYFTLNLNEIELFLK